MRRLVVFERILVILVYGYTGKYICIKNIANNAESMFVLKDMLTIQLATTGQYTFISTFNHKCFVLVIVLDLNHTNGSFGATS